MARFRVAVEILSAIAALTIPVAIVYAWWRKALLSLTFAVAIRFLRDLPRVLAMDGRAYLLLSRENAPARELAESSFHVKVKTSKDLFFERLEVLELRQGLE